MNLTEFFIPPDFKIDPNQRYTCKVYPGSFATDKSQFVICHESVKEPFFKVHYLPKATTDKFEVHHMSFLRRTYVKAIAYEFFSASYNAVGTVFWQKGKDISYQLDEARKESKFANGTVSKETFELNYMFVNKKPWIEPEFDWNDADIGLDWWNITDELLPAMIGAKPTERFHDFICQHLEREITV